MIFGKSDPKAPNVTMPPAAPLSTTPATPTSSATPAPSPAAAPASAPAAASPSSAKPRERQAATIRYVDRPEVAETFVDAVSGLIFDGQTLRIEFAVTRVDEVKPGTPISGRRYPACRVVLPPAAAVDLINRMQQIAAALTQAGVTKTTPRAGGKPQAS